MTVQNSYLHSARKVLDIEMSALYSLRDIINDSFLQACTLLRERKGKVIVCGVGKSGHIANKIAATLASTGTAAFSMHPTEASHGDLGAIEHKDIVVTISHSGSSTELTNLIPALKRRKIPIIAVTGNASSPLAKASDVHLLVKIEKEACPHNLAPTASTTATLVLGDMLAIALLENSGFSKDDFASSHPAGKLGKRLTLQVCDIMNRHLPLVTTTTSVRKALLVMTSHNLGMVGITKDNHISGVFTDGDLRRTLEKENNGLDISMEKVMTIDPITIPDSMLAIDALRLFEEKKINGVFVVDDNNVPIGAFNMHDLLQSGIV